MLFLRDVQINTGPTYDNILTKLRKKKMKESKLNAQTNQVVDSKIKANCGCDGVIDRLIRQPLPPPAHTLLLCF